MTIEIQVQNGKLIINVGGTASPRPAVSNKAQVTAQNAVGARPAIPGVGGDVGAEDTKSGGGVGAGAGTVVIGPIVIDAAGGRIAAADGKGGDVGAEDTKSGGGGSTGGSGGCVVIGPIVICGSGGASGATSTPPKVSTAVDVDPD